MSIRPAVLFALAILPATVAHADSFVTITFSFPETTIALPFNEPPDIISAINRSIVVPASPTPVAEPFNVAPGSFWLDPNGNPPGAYPPPGDVSYFFSQYGAGFVFTQDVNYPRAYYNFTSPQLFTGPASAPTFLSGTFAAQYLVPIFGSGYDFGTITIKPVTSVPSAVPEPSSFALLGTGMAGAMALLKRRRRRI